MSMNIVLYARKGRIISLFDVIQTPTEITEKILNSKNKLEAYRQYIINTYIKSDPSKHNCYYDHLSKLDLFIKDHKQKGSALYWENT